MFINCGFSYDGVHSDNYNISIVRIDSNGFIDGTFGYNRNINEEKIVNNPYPVKYNVGFNSLTLRIKISPLGNIWTDELRQNVVSWLFKNDYKPLISDDNLNIVYYCMPIGDTRRYFTGIKQGYIEIEFQCNAPWGFTTKALNTYNVSSSQSLTINNISNINDVQYVYPEIEFTITNGSTLSITCNGNACSFTGLSVGETVYMFGKDRRLKSSTNQYILDNFTNNNHWCRLSKGNNSISVSGNCSITFRYQFPIGY